MRYIRVEARMKDNVVALVEAIRLARLELDCYRDPRCSASPEWTIERLEHLLLDPTVSNAMAVLAPDAESPSIVPDPSDERVGTDEPAMRR
jgi:hypothetical protein